MVGRNMANGLYAGLAAGLVSGIMLWFLGILPSIAVVVGQEGDLMGFLLHMGGAVVLSVLFGLVFGGWAHRIGSGIFWGMLWGAILWVVWPLTLMPYAMGQGWGAYWTAGATASLFPYLIGYLAYGLVLGVVFGGLWRPRDDTVVVERRTVVHKTVTYP